MAETITGDDPTAGTPYTDMDGDYHLNGTTVYTEAASFSGELHQIDPLHLIGYNTGAGGAVTQDTSASTGVTLSKPCGKITTVALTTAAAAEERFTVTNTLVAATDTVVFGTTYDGDGVAVLAVQKVAAGAFDIVITNVHASEALNAVVVINFAVFKSVAA